MNQHRFALAALAAAAFLFPAHVRAAAGDDAQTTKLLTLSRAALGGDAIERAGVLQIDGKLSAGGLTGTVRSWSEMGGMRFAEEASLPPLVSGDGFDGTSVWNSDGTGLVWVDGGQSGRAAEIVQAFGTNYALWAKNNGGATVAWGGPKTAKGKTYDSLVVTPPQSPLPYEIWFDQTTHLPARLVLTTGPTVSTTDFADYRKVAGVEYPFAIHSESAGNVSDETVVTATANVPGGEAHLLKPDTKPHDFSIANGAAQTSVPIDLAENHVYLSVMLNGKGPYRFIFDTGGLNFIDPAVAKEIGAFGAGAMQGQGVGSNTESISFANVKTLQVGGATLNDQLFFVGPTRAGFGMSAGSPVDGLIGFEVLARFVTTFDYGTKTVTFQMPGAAMPSGADSIPFVLDGKQPQFPCGLDGIASQCTLDTGARDSVSFYGPFLTANPQIVPPTLTAVGVNGFGLGGPSMGKLGRVRSLTIGSFDIPNPIGDYTTQQEGAMAQPFVGANIGGGIWRRFALTLDYDALKMGLVANGAFAQADAWDRSGLFLINKGGTILVIDSRPGTPGADAGIAKGDAILTVDGKDVTTMSLSDIRAYFSGKPGTAIAVGVRAKDGTKRTVTLTLRDIV